MDREGLSGLPIPSDFGIDYEMIHQIQGIFTETGTPPEVNQKIGEAFRAATETDRYKAYIAQNSHVVPAFSSDVEANTKRFHDLLDKMKSALSEAGII